MFEEILLNAVLVFFGVFGALIGFALLFGAILLLVSIPLWMEKKGIPFGFPIGVALVIFIVSLGMSTAAYFSGVSLW